MIFVGTCTGGRVSDVHEVLDVLRRGGGGMANGVRLVVTPPLEEVQRHLMADGTLLELAALGAIDLSGIARPPASAPSFASWMPTL